MSAVLEVEDLRVEYVRSGRRIAAVNGVSFAIEAGETFGLVGESGCGKSTLSKAVMRLLPASAEVSGRVRFGGADVLELSAKQMRLLRGNRMSMVFQDPATSLDPTFSIGAQVAEVIREHRRVSKSAAKLEAIDLLRSVGFTEPGRTYGEPPHRLSGGMRQRVVIAIALANRPDLLLADEPTTALDVTIQAQVLRLMTEMSAAIGTATLLVTHNLGVVAQTCSRVAVMYAGEIVEIAGVEELFAAPRHPYTRALLATLPGGGHSGGRLPVIPGEVPDLSDLGQGCNFRERCPRRVNECEADPLLEAVSPDSTHSVACWVTGPRSVDHQLIDLSEVPA